ncbi:MAG: hypothetical protein V1787_02275 [Candidatus Micrarchaeota archaeon]
MGRSIPSVTARLDSKLASWRGLRDSLPAHEREAFDSLLSRARNRRTAIDAADEADIGVAILLVMLTRMRCDLDVLDRGNRDHATLADRQAGP